MNNTQKTVTLSLEVNDLNVIFAALQELPYRVADPLLKKLLQQAQSQLAETL